MRQARRGGTTACGANSSFTTGAAGGRSGIAFASEGEIYVMDAHYGGRRTRLTNNSVADFDPAWSPDGKKIVFATNRHDVANGVNIELYVMNADGTNQTRLTNTPAAEVYPAWSPDGTKIAFATDRDPGFDEVYVMNADGTNQVNVTNRPSFIDSDPSWSPDGRKIAFTASDNGAEPEIWSMNADGTNKVNLSNAPYEYDASPSWSPDALQISFESYRTGDGDIYTMSRNGQRQIRWDSEQPLAQEHYSTWSPFGEIAYTREMGAERAGDIIVGDRNITQTTVAESHPAWSPRPTITGD